jgi:hypothetical protein
MTNGTCVVHSDPPGGIQPFLIIQFLIALVTSPEPCFQVPSWVSRTAVIQMDVRFFMGARRDGNTLPHTMVICPRELMRYDSYCSESS